MRIFVLFWGDTTDWLSPASIDLGYIGDNYVSDPKETYLIKVHIYMGAWVGGWMGEWVYG